MDPTNAVLLGVVGLAITSLGWVLTRKGKQEENQLAVAKQNFDALTLRLTRAETGEQHHRERAEKAEEELDRQRDLWRKRLAGLEADHRETRAEEKAACRAEIARLTSALQLLQTVVVDEVAKTAAKQALGATKPHPHVDPVQELLEVEPDLTDPEPED